MSKLLNVLVTGPTGFIGQHLCDQFARSDYMVRAALHRQYVSYKKLFDHDHVLPVVVGYINDTTDWSVALAGVDVVVHLAARVHVMRERATDPIALYRAINTLGTIRLARSAATAGVRRLVYVSTIKVNGEATVDGAFHEDDTPRPCDPYAISKWEAEQALHRISTETGMEIVIIRPPLVYGPGVGGNFFTMLKWMERRIPLPLASIDNQRSLVGLSNLVSLLMTCMTHPRAAGEVFLISDGEDLSTPELLQRTAWALGKSPHLFPCPVGMLRMTARLLAKSEACERLCGSLVVDSNKARRLLGWSSVSSVDDELHRTAAWYQQLGAAVA
jgi:UDP-glucose 4-epimerase